MEQHDDDGGGGQTERDGQTMEGLINQRKEEATDGRSCKRLLERQMPQISSAAIAGIGTPSNFFTIERMRENKDKGG